MIQGQQQHPLPTAQNDITSLSRRRSQHHRSTIALLYVATTIFSSPSCCKALITTNYHRHLSISSQYSLTIRRQQQQPLMMSTYSDRQRRKRILPSEPNVSSSSSSTPLEQPHRQQQQRHNSSRTTPKKNTQPSIDLSQPLDIIPPPTKKYIPTNTIAHLLNDDDHDDDDDDDNTTLINDDDTSSEAANQIANREKVRMSEESQLRASLALKRRSSSTPTTKNNNFRASVRETGNDTMSHYLKSMGSHELLRHEDEVVLGKQIQILVRWEEVRQRLEEELLRAPTYAEWATATSTTVPNLKKQIRRSQRAKAALIEANLRLVVSIARQSVRTAATSASPINFQDACQEGIIGLTRACEKFDPEKGFRFSTYANWWIKRGVQKNVVEQKHGSATGVRLPPHVVEKINAIKIAEVTLREELGRRAKDEEVAERCEMSLPKLAFYRRAGQQAFSMDKTFKGKKGKGSAAEGGAGDGSFHDTIQCPDSTPTELANTQMLKDDVRRLIKTLSPREQAVIRLRFGLDDGKPKTLHSIGQQFQVTTEQIRKIEARALLKLRQPYRNHSVKCYISDL